MSSLSIARTALLTALIGFTCVWLLVRQNNSGSSYLQGGRSLQTSNGAVDFAGAKAQLKQLLSLIRQRYELNSTYGSNLFLASNNIDQKSWNILKYKFAQKIVAKNESFLMIFGGSSVTAGHDNFFNQSYPQIFHKRMHKIFESIGIELIVNNIAQGANNCMPYTHCYESMGGLNPDFLGWEQSYNCGRDPAIFEAVARLAGWPQLPGMVYYSASGAWLPKDCPQSPDPVPYCAEEWTPAVAGLADWNPSTEDLAKERDLLFKYNQGKSSAARFSSHYRNDYPNIGVHGFNVWEGNPHCSVYNEGEKKQKTNCNGIDAAAGCALKFMSQEASYYGAGKGANWHPSRAFHMLRGEAIAWIYSLILMEAIDMVEMDLQTKQSAELLQDYVKELSSHGHMPTDPKFCKNYRCEQRPTCFTDYKPHFAKNMTLSELIIGSTQWINDDNEYPSWSLTYGYLDLKPFYLANNASVGALHLRLPVGPKGYVWLCGPAKETLLHAPIWLDPHAAEPGNDLTVGKDGIYVPSSKQMEWKSKKYVGAECKELFDLPAGNHVLSISNSGDKTIALSHVITWL